MKHVSLYNHIALDIVYVNFISFYYRRLIISQSLSISEKKFQITTFIDDLISEIFDTR